MATPTLKVELAFLKYAGGYIWSDVSNYVRIVDIDRGISREIDKYSAGHAAVTLSNKDRAFDPTFTDTTGVVRTNYIKNPNFLLNTNGWSASNMTISQVGTPTYDYSTNAMKAVATSAVTPNVSYFGPSVTITTGETYTASIYVYGTVAKSVSLSLQWLNGGYGTVSTDTGTSITTTVGAWSRISVTGTVPATAVTVNIKVNVTAAINDVFYFDSALFEKSSTLGTYFDGDTIGAGVTCAWTGTAGNATSTATYYVSPFYGQVSPTGVIRITSGGIVQFYGFIDSWDYQFPESNFDSIAMVQAYDSLSILAKRYLALNVTQIQTTGQRISFALNRPEVQWDSALTDIDTGTSNVLDLDIAEGTNVLDYIQNIADAEAGDVFCSASGKITFRDRRYLDINWSTPTYRYNLAANPNLEGGITYWTVGSQNSTVKYIGTKSLKSAFVPADGWYEAVYSETNDAKYAASGTGNYTVSFYLYGTATSYNVMVTAYSGATVVSTTSAVKATTASTWTRVNLTLNVTGAFNKFEIYMDAAGPNFYVDSLLIEKTASLLDYFDGTYTPTPPSTTRYTATWDGTNNLSSSTLATQTLTVVPQTVDISLSDYSGSDIPVNDIKTTFASENLMNRVSLTANGGLTQVAEDTTLQYTYGIRSFALDNLYNNSDTVVLSNANEMLSNYARPEFRASEVTLQLHGLSGANQTTVLSMDLRKTAKLTFKPARTGSQMVKIYAIIGISHHMEDASHTITFRIASLQNAPFRLDSAITGVLDTNSIGYG